MVEMPLDIEDNPFAEMVKSGDLKPAKPTSALSRRRPE
jgi:hypothetical protein